MTALEERLHENVVRPKMVEALVSSKRDEMNLALWWCIDTPEHHYRVLCEFTALVTNFASEQAVQLFHLGQCLRSLLCAEGVDDLSKEFVGDMLKCLDHEMLAEPHTEASEEKLVKAVKALWNSSEDLSGLQFVNTAHFHCAYRPLQVQRSIDLLSIILRRCEVPIKDDTRSEKDAAVDEFLDKLELQILESDAEKILTWYEEMVRKVRENAPVDTVAEGEGKVDMFDDLFET